MCDSQLDVTIDKNERQLERHGSSAFPVAFYHRDLDRNAVVWHWHDELELTLVCQGAITVGAGAASAVLAAGEGCFIKAGALHNVWKADRGSCKYQSIVFHPRLLGGMDSVFWLNYVRPLEEPDFPRLVPFFKQEQADFSSFFTHLWEMQEHKRTGYENDIRYLLTKFAARLSNTPVEKECQPSVREARDMERMKVMLSFLEAHYAEELTLGQIAGSACISETECMRCFRRSVGVSPVRFLKERRLQHAARLIRDTERSISEVAASCGFWDTSYFAKAFHQLYGVPPTAYRRSLG